MTVGEFIKTEQGSKYRQVLQGCNKNWDVYHWDRLAQYEQSLIDNNWDKEDIKEQMEYIKKDCYKADENDEDFVEIIN